MEQNCEGKNNPNYKDGRTLQHRGAWNSWRAMKDRCDKENNAHYRLYGGRGITYCERWKDFAIFLADMGDRPEGKSLDRIDNNLGYYPENCRWASQKEQVGNSSKVLRARVTASEIKESPCSASCIYQRLRKGWSKQDALNIPPDFERKERHYKRMSHIRPCKVCGKRCKRPGAIYCSSKCCARCRLKDERGLFRKENHHEPE